jgi:hypothetical protein
MSGELTDIELRVIAARGARPKRKLKDIAIDLGISVHNVRYIEYYAQRKLKFEDAKHRIKQPRTVREALDKVGNELGKGTHGAVARLFYGYGGAPVRDDTFGTFLQLLQTDDLLAERHIGASRLAQLRHIFLGWKENADER